MTRHLGGAFAAAIALCACGGSNSGSGSKSLHVAAVAQSDGSTDGTFMVVQIREGHPDGPLVSDATVSLRGDKTGDFTLPWQESDFFGFRIGSYRKSSLLWDTGWHLDVKRGEEGLEAYLEAPGMTSITEPLANTTFRLADGQPLVVRWKDGEGRRAETVEVALSTSDFAWALREDPLQYSVDPTRLVAADAERVDVVRQNEIELAGGTPGSAFVATSRHRITFAVE